MGCGNSSPVLQEDEQQNTHKIKVEEKKYDASATIVSAISAVPVVDNGKGDDSNAKAKSTRARRLSYVKGTENGVAVPDGGGAKPNTPPNEQSKERSQSQKARGRRLSYVTHDPNAIPVPFKDGDADEEQNEEVDQEIPPAQPVGAPVSAGEGGSGGGTLGVSVACMSRAGKEPGFKKTNQDNCFAFEKYITEDQSLFAAMDGHGPHVNHLTTERDVKKALTSGFVEVDKSLGNSRIDCEFSGSTAVVSYLKDRTLTTAWVGDSRGVLGRHTDETGWQAVDLTNDHKPTNPEEKARILRSNGRVERLVDEMGQPMGPHRVWLQYAWIPGLAMSRALGDVLAHQVGVASEPEHSVIELDPSHKFMILASDGVWEFISSKEAVEIVCQYDTVEEACRQLVDEAYQRWLTEEEGVVDDITAVIVRFLH